MRPLLALAALLLLAGCLAPTGPPGSGVHAETFTRDGGPWRAYHLSLCGLCGSEGPATLFVVFADGNLLQARMSLKTDAPVRLAEGVTYDADEIASILEGRGGNVTEVTTAALDDVALLGELDGRWQPRQREDATCADYAAEYGWWPDGGAPSRVTLTCPADEGAPMQPFAAQLATFQAGLDALRQTGE